MNANDLVSLVEVLCALMIGGMKPTAHDLIIPESWLFVLAQRMQWPPMQIWTFLDDLLDPLLQLCRLINSGSGESSADIELAD